MKTRHHIKTSKQKLWCNYLYIYKYFMPTPTSAKITQTLRGSKIKSSLQQKLLMTKSSIFKMLSAGQFTQYRLLCHTYKNDYRSMTRCLSFNIYEHFFLSISILFFLPYFLFLFRILFVWGTNIIDTIRRKCWERLVPYKLGVLRVINKRIAIMLIKLAYSFISQSFFSWRWIKLIPF